MHFHEAKKLPYLATRSSESKYIIALYNLQ